MARCSYNGRRGQCTLAQVDHSEFCRKHSKESDRMKRYRISDPELNARFGHHSGDPDALKTVAEEIAFLRFMIEDRLDMATSKAERLAAYSTITPMIAQVGKLVESLTKLERQSSTVIGKAALHKLGSQIVTILVEELNDIDGRDTIIDKVAARIGDAVAAAHNEEE